MIFDADSIAARDKNEMFDACRMRSVNNQLNHWSIDNRQHFFEDGFRCGEKTRAEASNRDYGLSYTAMHDRNLKLGSNADKRTMFISDFYHFKAMQFAN
jgi:hypothetical protein